MAAKREGDRGKMNLLFEAAAIITVAGFTFGATAEGA